MAKVITIMNMKGGVGKTTVAMHLGGVLGLYKVLGKQRKVLLIDYDPQFNLSQAFIPAKEYFALEAARKTCLSILLDDETDIDPFVLQVAGNAAPPPLSELVHRVYDNLDIIPSTLDLMYVALGQSDIRTKPCEERFGKFIAECRKNYDMILIDCHPAGSILTKTSLQNSDDVIIPVVPERFAVRGIGLMMEFIASKRLGRAGPIPHILFNRIPRSGERPKEETEIRTNPRFTDKCLSEVMHKYSVFTEPVGGKGFAWFSNKSYSTQAWNNVCDITDELAKRMGIDK